LVTIHSHTYSRCSRIEFWGPWIMMEKIIYNCIILSWIWAVNYSNFLNFFLRQSLAVLPKPVLNSQLLILFLQPLK
jgi:hypothetical protein